MSQTHTVVACSTRFHVIGISPGMSEPLVMIQRVGGVGTMTLPVAAFARLDYVPADGDAFDLDYNLVVKQVPGADENDPTFAAAELTGLRNLTPGKEGACVAAR